MCETRYLVLVGVLLLAAPSWAQDAGPPEATPDAGFPESLPSSSTPDFERPKLVEDSPPRYPEAAYAEQLEADVALVLTVDETGRVTDTQLATPAGHGFDEEALAAARRLRFSPARLGGVPTAVQIKYTFRFRIPEKETVSRTPLATCEKACPEDTRQRARLTVTVYERGKGKLLPGVEVYFLDQDRVYLTDASGQISVELVPGAYALTIRPPDYYVYETSERLNPGDHLTVKYFIRKNRRARYKTIVWGTEGRAEVARTTLVDDEIRAIPGTFGDPLRVMTLLPGSTSSISGMGYPIVRGSLPGESLYEVDGISVPMLYHLLLGNAVIHPRFVDQVTFQPGGFGADSGRFVGGHIAASTTRVGEDPLWAADLSLISTSLLRSQKVSQDGEVLLAARYGTLGYIIEGLAANTVFRYWDYQARYAHRLPNGGLLTLTALGVEDAAGEENKSTGEESVLHIGFQRLDLRYRQAGRRGWIRGGVQAGYEYFRPPDRDDSDEPDADDHDSFRQGAAEWMLRPYVELGTSPVSGLDLTLGADLLWQDFGMKLGESFERVFFNPDTGLTLGAFATASVKLGGLLIQPGLRVDHYRYGSREWDPRATSVDPRLAVSYEIRKDLTVKASAGVYHGPPRISFVKPPIVFGPIPAYNSLGLEYGLNRSYQLQAGVEAALPAKLHGTFTAYYHDHRTPVDFGLVEKPQLRDQLLTLDPPPIDGVSYGAELMVRRRLGEDFFGWVSYAISRSERTVPGFGTFPFDFDQTHVLNTVMSWEVGRNWTLGAVVHVNSGRPYTKGECQGRAAGKLNASRFPTYWRVDARVQKREVFDTWYFDFYIDLFNAAFQFEVVDYVCSDAGFEPVQIPLFVPIIGLRGEF
jgi:TonB family protein